MTQTKDALLDMVLECQKACNNCFYACLKEDDVKMMAECVFDSTVNVRISVAQLSILLNEKATDYLKFQNFVRKHVMLVQMNVKTTMWITVKNVQKLAVNVLKHAANMLQHYKIKQQQLFH